MPLRILFFLLSFGLVMLLSERAEAQHRCGNPEVLGKENTQWKSHKQGIDTSTVWRLPVVFHIMHQGEALGQGTNISQAQITSQLQVLNEDFRRKPGTPGFNNHPDGADPKLEFFLAQRDPNGNPTAGVNRVRARMTSYQIWEADSLSQEALWPTDQYINIWVCSLKGGFYGFSAFPESDLPGLSSTPQNPNTDGLLLHYEVCGMSSQHNAAPFDKGRTLTHELGHYLGLKHTWGNNRGCGSLGDYCEDTPVTDGPNFGCPVGNNSCPEPGQDMVENYMEYTDDACMNIFTQDQVFRMRYVLTHSPRRKSLIKSPALGLEEHSPAEKPTLKMSPSAIQLNLGQARWQLRLFDLQGSLILSRGDLSGKARLNLPPGLPKGLYVLEIISGQKRYTYKIPH